MRRLVAASLACAVAGVPVAARADLFSSVSYGAQISTLGAGITLEKPLLYNFSARIVTGAGSISEQLRYNRTPYMSTTKLNNVAVIADYRPYAGRYRISGGLLFGNDRIDNTARPLGPTIGVGSGVYPVSATGVVTSRLAFDRPAIYAGVGTGTGLVRGFALTFDAGALVRNGTASVAASGPLAADPAFRANLAQLRGELRTRLVVPVLSVGLVFRP